MSQRDVYKKGSWLLPMESKKRVFTVLAIDGGGVKGIIPARLLQAIEEKTGKPISELFDMVGGNSTGSILAAGLSVPDPVDPKKPKFSAKDLLGLYFEHSPRIFPETRFRQLFHLLPGMSGFYDPTPLEEVLKNYFGDTKVKDSLTHLMIPAVDIKKYKPLWIKHLKGQKEDPENWGSMLMRDAIRGSTAAPTLLPSKYVYTTPDEKRPEITDRHAIIDGTFFAGNITRRLYGQAQKVAPPDAEIVVVHIGTGYKENTFSPDEFNKISPYGLISKKNGSIIINMALDMTQMDVNETLREEIGDRFFSFDKAFDPYDKSGPTNSIDNAQENNLIGLEKFAEKMIRDEDAQLTRLCKILLEKTCTDDLHKKSERALQKLTDLMGETKNVKDLNHTYAKIVKYSSDLTKIKFEPGDEKIRDLSQQLVEKHKNQLDRIYNALAHDKQTDTLKRKMMKRITGFFNSFSDPPPPSDEETPPPPPPAPPPASGPAPQPPKP